MGPSKWSLDSGRLVLSGVKCYGYFAELYCVWPLLMIATEDAFVTLHFPEIILHRLRLPLCHTSRVYCLASSALHSFISNTFSNWSYLAVFPKKMTISLSVDKTKKYSCKRIWKYARWRAAMLWYILMTHSWKREIHENSRVRFEIKSFRINRLYISNIDPQVHQWYKNWG